MYMGPAAVLARSCLYCDLIIVYCNVCYSNLGFGLLGRCLVEHTFPGMTYEDYVIKNILQPLQLTNTGFTISSRYIYSHER